MAQRHPWRVLLRFSIVLLGLICCFRLIQDSVRAGVSRLFSATAIIQSRIEAADEAVRLAPSDPEAHYTRALGLVNLERLEEAIVELRQATRLRPHHYYEWLDLGVTLDRLGDQTSAEAALRESIRLAPFFAQPHWQLGNFLFRQGRYEEAFAELRLGVKSNSSLFEGMMQLAWVAFDGDVGTMEANLQPQSRRHHLELARFLALHEKGLDAAHQVAVAGELASEEERTLRRQIVSDLLAGQLFSDAYAAWATSHPEAGSRGPGQLLNGDFVEPIRQGDPGFGWQVLATPNVVVSLDPSGPTPGARSVRIEFSGDHAPGSQPINQLVLLQPKTRYSLSFMVRAENLVSGGPPLILVLDGGSRAMKILAQSKPFAPGTSEWSAYQMDFATEENTAAVMIALQRAACGESPCPIFGRLWLSRFSLVKVGG
jgi:tetratricopeptide (TPR) repeat protein